MNTIWGDITQYDPVIWNWVIAVYLFLAGLSAGSLIIALGLKWFSKEQAEDGGETPILKAAAFSAPIIITLGLACLVLDLTKPLNFYKILIMYNLSSVMSLGVIALLIYTPMAYVYAILVLDEEIASYLPVKYKPKLELVTEVLTRFRKPLEIGLFLMSLVIAIYTGFLLSAMNAYPMLNTAVLPALFLFSALSAGAAVNNVLALTMFGGSTSDKESERMHRLEPPIIGFEIMFLFLLFIALYFAGGASAQAVKALSNGTWAFIFWMWVVLVGFGIPILVSILPDSVKHSRYVSIGSACASLAGVLALRHFILYAGQSYIS